MAETETAKAAATLAPPAGSALAAAPHHGADPLMALIQHLAERWPTPEHLRKWLLIKAGYHDERSIVAASKAEAHRIATFVKPLDDYAIITVTEAVVTIYTAKSQSMRAMGKQEFGESKRKVLEMLSGMIGVSQEDLNANAGRAA